MCVMPERKGVKLFVCLHYTHNDQAHISRRVERTHCVLPMGDSDMVSTGCSVDCFEERK